MNEKHISTEQDLIDYEAIHGELPEWAVENREQTEQYRKATLANLAESAGLKMIGDHIDPPRIADLEHFCAELGRELETAQQERTELREDNWQLLIVAKEFHGYDDPLHQSAMPNCWQCAVIRKSEQRYANDQTAETLALNAIGTI